MLREGRIQPDHFIKLDLKIAKKQMALITLLMWSSVHVWPKKATLPVYDQNHVFTCSTCSYWFPEYWNWTKVR